MKDRLEPERSVLCKPLPPRKVKRDGMLMSQKNCNIGKSPAGEWTDTNELMTFLGWVHIG